MTESEIRNYLTTRLFGRTIYAFDAIDSTNAKAKALALNGAEEGTLVIAEEQTAGKGRHGRTWLSENGKNLTFSILLKPMIPVERIGIISLFAAVAAAEAIENATGFPPVCKWPNDVLLNGKKVCGILTETVIQQNTLSSIVVGIGINVNQSIFAAELADRGTSLLLASGKTVDRLRLLSLALERMEHWYQKVSSRAFSEILNRWNCFCTMDGQTIRVDRRGRTITGIVRGFAEDGGLLIQVGDGEIKLLSGDVTLLHN